MKKITAILIFLFLPVVVLAYTERDFIVNRQSTYDIPYNAQNVLVLDLTAPAPISSIVLHNNGTADQLNIAKLIVWEDGISPGWDNDERSVAILSAPPFFDTPIKGDFAQKRIFVTINTSETGTIERTVKLQIPVGGIIFANSSKGTNDTVLDGFERKIIYGDSPLDVPATPIAGKADALSSHAIRWHFIDIANNEFGFKLLDENSKVLVRKEEADLSYLDELGLSPGTTYSGRRIVAFNDRGESMVSVSSIFPGTQTLPLEQKEVPITEKPSQNEVAEIPAATQAPVLLETIQIKIADLQRQINDLLKQITELAKQSSAMFFEALQGFLRTFFEK